jgi:hypothetical protein
MAAPTAATAAAVNGSNMITIDWPCDSVVASKKCESTVIQVLHRKGEWGRGRDLPQRRLDEISRSCQEQGMTLYQALSLRRSMLRSLPGGMRRVNQSSSMGSAKGQQQIATLFEEALVAFLKTVTLGQDNVFRTESQLIAESRAGLRANGPTPDILFLKPVTINGKSVKWIDAKLFYASATFASNKKIPNGKLQTTALRYNNHFGGQGAFVFGQGFCADLATMVPGALLLDATPFDMTAVEAFQDAS